MNGGPSKSIEMDLKNTVRKLALLCAMIIQQKFHVDLERLVVGWDYRVSAFRVQEFIIDDSVINRNRSKKARGMAFTLWNIHYHSYACSNDFISILALV
jgi:hypothetical protein